MFRIRLFTLENSKGDRKRKARCAARCRLSQMQDAGQDCHSAQLLSSLCSGVEGLHVTTEMTHAFIDWSEKTTRGPVPRCHPLFAKQMHLFGGGTVDKPSDIFVTGTSCLSSASFTSINPTSNLSSNCWSESAKVQHFFPKTL